MAYLWEEMLGNVDEAIATYKEVLGADSANVKALKALDRLYLGQKQWRALADNLTRQLQLTDDKPETIGLLVRLAALRERELGEVAAAVDTYRQVLDLDRDNDEALRGARAAGVRCPITSCRSRPSSSRSTRRATSGRSWSATYEILVRHSMDPARKIELLHQIGDLYEMASEDARGVPHLRPRAARGAGAQGDADAPRAAGAHARSLEGPRVACTTRSPSRWPSRRATSSCRRSCLTRIAQIEETQLGDNDAAAAAYHRVLKVAPHQLDAANALEAIYLRTDAYTKLVDVVLAKVDIVTDVAEKKELLFKAAQIYEEVLENADRAIDVYRQVMSLDENDRHGDRRARAARTSASSAGSRSRTSTRRRPSWPRSPTRRSRCSSSSGRSTTASSRI